MQSITGSLQLGFFDLLLFFFFSPQRLVVEFNSPALSDWFTTAPLPTFFLLPVNADDRYSGDSIEKTLERGDRPERRKETTLQVYNYFRSFRQPLGRWILGILVNDLGFFVNNTFSPLTTHSQPHCHPFLASPGRSLF